MVLYNSLLYSGPWQWPLHTTEAFAPKAWRPEKYYGLRSITGVSAESILSMQTSAIVPFKVIFLLLSHLSQSRCYIHLRWSCSSLILTLWVGVKLDMLVSQREGALMASVVEESFGFHMCIGKEEAFKWVKLICIKHKHQVVWSCIVLWNPWSGCMLWAAWVISMSVVQELMNLVPPANFSWQDCWWSLFLNYHFGNSIGQLCPLSRH